MIIGASHFGCGGTVLYAAVAHGCLARQQKPAYDTVYRPRVRRENEYFTLRTQTQALVQQEYRVKQVVLAVGDMARPRLLNIPGEDLSHVTHYFEDPHQYAVGMHYVLVNGQLVVADGEHTGRRPGKIIYGPGYTGN